MKPNNDANADRYGLALGRSTTIKLSDNHEHYGTLSDISEFGIALVLKHNETQQPLGIIFVKWECIKTVIQFF